MKKLVNFTYLIYLADGYIAGVSILAITLAIAIFILIALIIYAVIMEKGDGEAKGGNSSPRKSQKNGIKEAHDEEDHAG